LRHIQTELLKEKDKSVNYLTTAKELKDSNRKLNEELKRKNEELQFNEKKYLENQKFFDKQTENLQEEIYLRDNKIANI
jgi:hypothetical protein